MKEMTCPICEGVAAENDIPCWCCGDAGVIPLLTLEDLEPKK